MRGLFLAVALSLAACSAPSAPDRTTAPAGGAAGASVPKPAAEMSLADAINAARTKAGLAPLRPSAALDGSARFFVRDMVRNRYFGAETQLGLNTAGRAVLGGYCPLGVREIVAYSTDSDAAFVETMLETPSQRDVLLWPDAVEFGAARLMGRTVVMLGDGC